jgi:hypothetical protein
MTDGKNGDPRQEPIYAGILNALMATVTIAAVISLSGDLYFDNAAMKHGGFAIAIVAGVTYFGFRIWGSYRAEQWRKEKERRELSGEDDADRR